MRRLSEGYADDVTSKRSRRALLICHVDAQVNDAVDKILRSRQTTVLFVAHRLSTIARAERIVVLEGTS